MFGVNLPLCWTRERSWKGGFEWTSLKILASETFCYEKAVKSASGSGLFTRLLLNQQEQGRTRSFSVVAAADFWLRPAQLPLLWREYHAQFELSLSQQHWNFECCLCRYIIFNLRPKMFSLFTCAIKFCWFLMINCIILFSVGVGCWIYFLLSF